MIKKEEGSVSLYLLIILSTFLILFTVLVDAIHIRTADYHAETALRSALRSSLSDTDPKLRDFGLYAMNLERSSRHIFENTLASHEEAWPAKWEIGETYFQTDSNHSLASHDVLYRQILETMKYQAPVEFGLQVMNAFQAPDTRSTLLESTTLFRQSEQLEALMVQRDAHLTQVWKQMDKLFGVSGNVRVRTIQWQDTWTAIEEKLDQIGGTSYAELTSREINMELEQARIIAEIRDAEQKLAHEEVDESTRESLLEHIRKLNLQLTSIQESLAEVTHQLKLFQEVELDIAQLHFDVQLTQSIVVEGTEEMRHNLQIAKDLNEQIKQMTGQFMARDENESIDLHLPSEIITQYALPASLFQNFRTQLGKGIALSTHFITELERVEQGWEQRPPFHSIRAALHQFVDHYTLFYTEQKQLEATFISKRQSAEEEKQGYLNKIKQTLSQITELVYQCVPGDEYQYERLKELESKYRNENDIRERDKENILTEDVLFHNDQTASHAMAFLEKMQKAMIVVRDKAYLNEYILSYFQNRTSMTQESIPPHRSKQRESILLGQETEYILYGFHSCQANHGAAFAELYAFRLGVRMTETLLDSRRWGASAVSPVVTFLWAAAESAGKALDDVRKLVEGEALLLSERFPVKVWLSYDDYLRLFLLLHGNKEESLTRIQALIELGNGKALFDAYTYAQATVKMEVNRDFIHTFERTRTFTDSYYY